MGELVQALSRLPAAGRLEQTVLVPRENQHSAWVRKLSGCHGVRIRPAPARSSGAANTIRWDQVILPALALESGADALFIPHINVPLRPRTPTFVVFHDASIYDAPAGFGWRSRAYYRTILRAGIRRMTKVLTVSEWSRAALLRHFPDLAGKIEVVYPGVAAEFFNVNCAEARRIVEREFSIRAPYLLYSGGFGARKNLDRTLQAFAGAITDAKLPHCLLMTGVPTNGAARLIREACPNGMSSRVLQLGHVTDRALANLYAASDLCLYPSLYEGFGFPVAEAMAAGTPSVTTAGSPMQEVAGNAALYADPTSVDAIQSAIITGLTDAGLRQRLIADGQRRVRTFSWDKCAAAIYRLVCACP
jgi:glycosyltransferase involved in cell wall biosynthesis